MARSGSFVLVAALAGITGLYIAASVLRVIFFPARVAGRPTAAEVAECTRDVRALLSDLVGTATLLQLDAVGGRAGDLPERWDEFSRRWTTEWRDIDVRCRFSELGASGQGRPYERTAEIHRSLPKVADKYKSLMARFGREQAPELARMRRTLDESLRSLSGP